MRAFARYLTILALASAALALTGCKKAYHIVIVNRYPNAVHWIDENGTRHMIPENGTAVAVSTLDTGDLYVFEVRPPEQVTHRVENIPLNVGKGDVYVISLDPKSKNGAGQDQYPVRPFD